MFCIWANPVMTAKINSQFELKMFQIFVKIYGKNIKVFREQRKFEKPILLGIKLHFKDFTSDKIFMSKRQSGIETSS